MKTRHFYEDDEVIAALHWCLKKGRVKEAVFWCLELLDSEMMDTLSDELYKAWLWYFGVGALSTLPILSVDTREDCLKLVCGLARLSSERRDRSVLALLLLGLQETQCDRPSYFPNLQELFERLGCTPLEKAFCAALFQGKARLAFDLSRSQWQANPDRVYELVHEIMRFKHKSQEADDCITLLEFYKEKNLWATRACCIASVSLTRKQMAESMKPLRLEIPPEIQEAIEEWASLTGRRLRRVFQIPHECLYMRTKRGLLSNKVSTLSDLYAISDSTLEGCPFWNRVLEEEVPWLDDDRKEAFYELYFPDDIPDEWSREAQEKSHGFGALINNEVPTLKKYRDRWFRSTPTRAIWFLNRDLSKWNVESEKSWVQLYERPWSTIVSTWCLTPVKKRILVVNEPVALG